MEEQQRLAVLQQIESSKSLDERNKLGQFATPPSLAREIVEASLTYLDTIGSIRYLEPGFGTGPFFLATHKLAGDRLAAALGFEIDPNYAQAATRLYSDTMLRLRLEDFLQAEPPTTERTRFQLVICNPPYVRHQHLSKVQKLQLRQMARARTSLSVSGLSGLYTYFLLGSKAWMSRDGIGAWLIPSEFMDVNYGRQVKEFLTTQVQLLRIHYFPPACLQFDDALVTSTVVIFRNASPGQTVDISLGSSLQAPRTTKILDRHELTATRKWSNIFTTSRGTKSPVRASTSLADCFTIKRGLATGNNSFFVLTSQEVSERSLPDEFLRPLLPSPRRLETDIVLADSEGLPRVRERRWLLSCDLPESEIRRRHPTLWVYFEEGLQERVHQGYLCGHRAPWYRQELRPPAPFLCTYMGRCRGEGQVPFRFVLNRSQATATNVYLMLYPKPQLLAFLDRDERYIEVWEALRTITANSLRSEGRVYGGGLHKLEPRELANVDGQFLTEWMASHQRAR